jgi:hypothetical protein
MLHNTYTTDDLVERLALMRKYYGQRLFSGAANASLHDALKSECSTHTIEALTTWETRFTTEGISPLVVYEALDAVEEDLAGIPAVTFYVPIHFGPEHIERFGRWFRENVQPNILLTVRTDPRMVGGCGVIWKGTYYDLSLRYYVTARRNDIVKMFDKYTHAR